MLTNRCVAASFALATWITAMKLTSAGVFHAKLLRVLLVINCTYWKEGACIDPNMQRKYGRGLLG